MPLVMNVFDLTEGVSGWVALLVIFPSWCFVASDFIARKMTSPCLISNSDALDPFSSMKHQCSLGLSAMEHLPMNNYSSLSVG